MVLLLALAVLSLNLVCAEWDYAAISPESLPTFTGSLNAPQVNVVFNDPEECIYTSYTKVSFMSFIFSAMTACSDLEMIEHKGVASIRTASWARQSIACLGVCLLLSLCSKPTQALSNACDSSRAHLSIARGAEPQATTSISFPELFTVDMLVLICQKGTQYVTSVLN